MKHTRQNWINFTAENGIIELVNADGNIYLYVTRSKSYDGRSSMYHVWKDDDWIYCGPSYSTAVTKFRDKIRERDEEC